MAAEISRGASATFTLVLLTALSAPVVAQTRDRASIDAQAIWRLEEIYPSDEAWSAAKDQVEAV